MSDGECTLRTPSLDEGLPSLRRVKLRRLSPFVNPSFARPFFTYQLDMLESHPLEVPLPKDVALCRTYGYAGIVVQTIPQRELRNDNAK